jgi:hypothetical protein
MMLRFVVLFIGLMILEACKPGGGGEGDKQKSNESSETQEYQKIASELNEMSKDGPFAKKAFELYNEQLKKLGKKPIEAFTSDEREKIFGYFRHGMPTDLNLPPGMTPGVLKEAQEDLKNIQNIFDKLKNDLKTLPLQLQYLKTMADKSKLQIDKLKRIDAIKEGHLFLQNLPKSQKDVSPFHETSILKEKISKLEESLNNVDDFLKYWILKTPNESPNSVYELRLENLNFINIEKAMWAGLTKEINSPLTEMSWRIDHIEFCLRDKAPGLIGDKSLYADYKAISDSLTAPSFDQFKTDIEAAITALKSNKQLDMNKIKSIITCLLNAALFQGGGDSYKKSFNDFKEYFDLAGQNERFKYIEDMH